MKPETKPKPKLPKIPDAPESRACALAAEAWPVDRPKPYAKNPRRNDAAVEKVAASIREFGWAQPIVVDGDGVIIIGHTRLKAAKKLGLKTVPVLVRADHIVHIGLGSGQPFVSAQQFFLRRQISRLCL